MENYLEDLRLKLGSDLSEMKLPPEEYLKIRPFLCYLDRMLENLPREKTFKEGDLRGIDTLRIIIGQAAMVWSGNPNENIREGIGDSIYFMSLGLGYISGSLDDGDSLKEKVIEFKGSSHNLEFLTGIITYKE
jgi:hypothetical protein